MKPTAILVNTSRGPVLDEDVLVDTLREKRISTAAIDVYDIEPLAADHPLRTLPNALLTGHIGYVTDDLDRTFYQDSVEDIAAFQAGAPARRGRRGGADVETSRRHADRAVQTQRILVCSAHGVVVGRRCRGTGVWLTNPCPHHRSIKHACDRIASVSHTSPSAAVSERPGRCSFSGLSVLIGTLRWAYHVVLQRNNGHPDLVRQPCVSILSYSPSA
jgi:hypothetical protein